MTSTLHALEHVLRTMPRALIRDELRTRLISEVPHLAPRPDLAIVEIRALETDPQVDISVAVVSAEARVDFAAHAERLRVTRSSSWHAISEFARAWNDPTDPSFESVIGVYLEQDCPVHTDTMRSPAMFLRTSRLTELQAPDVTSSRVLALISRLVGQHEPALLARARMVLEQLPSSHHVAYVGLMFPRDDERLRLCLVLPAPEVPRVLASIGLSSCLEGHSAFLYRMQRSGWVDVAVGFTADRMTERVGIELAMNLNGRCDESPLALLVAQSLCASHRARSIARVIESHQSPSHSCELSHVKIALRPGRSPEPKVYLAVASRAQQRRNKLFRALRQIQARGVQSTVRAH